MDLLFSFDEVVKLTGGYVAPAAQLRELHRQGFFRARRSNVTGAVILERSHYDAVTRGATLAAQQEPEAEILE